MSLFEACGAMDDPEYHTPTDVVGRVGFDIEGSLMSISKATAATAMEILVPSD